MRWQPGSDEALRLHFEEHLPRVVAGRRLGVPKSTVCSMFVRFRNKLSFPVAFARRHVGAAGLMPAFTDNFPRYQSYVLKAPLYPKPPW